MFFFYILLGVHWSLYFSHLSDISRALNAICLGLHFPSLSSALHIPLISGIHLFPCHTLSTHLSPNLFLLHQRLWQYFSRSLFASQCLICLSLPFISKLAIFSPELWVSVSNLSLIISSTFFLTVPRNLCFCNDSSTFLFFFTSSSHLRFLCTFWFSNHNHCGQPSLCLCLCRDWKRALSGTEEVSVCFFFVFFCWEQHNTLQAL